MLGDTTRADNMYVVTGYTDMRRSVDSLLTIVMDHLHMTPDLTSILFLLNKRPSKDMTDEELDKLSPWSD